MDSLESKVLSLRGRSITLPGSAVKNAHDPSTLRPGGATLWGLARRLNLRYAEAMSDVQQTIRETIEQNRVVLFMKGTKNFPQCGFSARAVEILKTTGVPFKDVNVLADPAIRQGIKDFSNWPTIPQVYVEGKFVGGSDILYAMYESGELAKLLSTPAA